MRTAILLIISVSFSSCATLSFQNIGFLQKSLGIASLPVQSEYPGADAVIILEETDLKTVVNPNYVYHTTVTVRRVERVFSNVQKESSVTIRLRPGQSLLAIKARTVEPDGRSVPVKSGDFHVTYGTPARRSVFHSDDGTIKFEFPAVKSGEIVEYAYQLKEEVPFPNFEWVIQRDIPIMRNVFSLTAPSYIVGDSEKDAEEWRWNYVTYNYPDIGNPSLSMHYGSYGPGNTWQNTFLHTMQGASESNGTGGSRREYSFTWTLKDVPAFNAEPEMPPKDWYRGYVQFAPSYWQSWDDLSKSYYEYNVKPSLTLTDDIMGKADSLVAGAHTVVDTLDDIYRYVQGIRYSENKQRLGTLAPEAAEEVLKSGEGDCRGKAMLLTALLRAVGISAKPAVIVTRSGGRLDPNFPCWRFHRIIVGALISGDRIVWFDPAAKFCGVGVVPPEDEDATLLVLNENGSSFFIRTPSSKVWDNMISMKIDVSEHLNGPSEFHVDAQYGGEAGLIMRNKFADSTGQNLREYCEAMIGNTFRDSKLIDCSSSPPESEEVPFTVKFDFEATNIVRGDSDLYSLYADPFPSVVDLNWLTTGTRMYPVEFRYPYIFSKTVDATFSDSALAVKKLPEGIRLSTPDCYYSSSYSRKKPLHIVFTEVLSLNTRMLQANGYQQAANFFEEIGESKAEPAILMKK